MQVKTTQFGDRKKPRWDDLPISDNYDGVRFKLLQKLLRSRSADFLRLVHGNPRSERRVLHW